MIHLGNVPANSTLYIPFATYDGTTGASETCSGLAVTDIEIYKNGSTTQRASDAGYTLLDTDGIDFDSVTGINGFSIDLSDNSDAGFYSVGGFYWVVVSSITADSQTVNFIAATFRIVAAEAISGKPKVDVDALLGTAWLAPGTAGTPDVNVKLLSGDSGAADNAEAFFDGTGYAGTNNVIPTVTTLTNLPAITANWLTAAGVAADVATELAAPILAVLGALSDAASDGDPTTTDTAIAYLKQIINTLEGSAGIPTFPSAAAPANAVSLAEIIRSIYTQLGVAGAGLTAIPGPDSQTLSKHIEWISAATHGDCNITGSGPYTVEYLDILGNIVISSVSDNGERTVTRS